MKCTGSVACEVYSSVIISKPKIPENQGYTVPTGFEHELLKIVSVECLRIVSIDQLQLVLSPEMLRAHS